MYEHYLIFIVIVIILRRLETTIARLFPYREGVLLDIGQLMIQGVPKRVLIECCWSHVSRHPLGLKNVFLLVSY